MKIFPNIDVYQKEMMNLYLFFYCYYCSVYEKGHFSMKNNKSIKKTA